MDIKKRFYISLYTKTKSKIVDYALTKEKFFLYIDKYPYVYKNKKICRIHGEIYHIDHDLLKNSNFKDYPIDYKREKYLLF